MKIIAENIEKILIRQLRNFWYDIDEEPILSAIPMALKEMEDNYRGLPNKAFYDGNEVIFSPYMSVQWMNFLYRLSHILYNTGGGYCADQVYYLNKIMHGNDWFYAVELPVHFLCEHPLGSVLGRAKYGEYFFIYQGVTVGGNRKNGELYYPEIGENVILFANAAVLGNTKIGNNVVVSADTYLINEEIPDNSIVFGKSPSIVIRNKPEDEIKSYSRHIWGWR